jgi:predicted ester cyclase
MFESTVRVPAAATQIGPGGKAVNTLENSQTDVHASEDSMLDEHSDQIKEILRSLPPAERQLLASHLRSNGGTALEATQDADRGYQDPGLVYRYVQDLVTTRGNGQALPQRLRDHVIELLRLNLDASSDNEPLSEGEQRRREYLELTARYVKEQQARNYVLPEDTTAMTAPQKDHLFDQIVAGRISRTDEERRVENVAIFYRYIEVENTRDYENMKKLFHPTQFCSKTYFGNDPIHPDAHVRMLKGLFRAFPDWFMVIGEIIASDPVAVVGLITGRGTQYEEFWGRPPADHQIAIPTLHAIKVRKGLIVEHRHINPFENIFANQIMAPLTSDIMAVRAQQGFDSSMSQKAFELALAAGASEEKLNELRELVKAKARQCQVLLKGTLRRCAMIAEPNELYCAHHMEHGYGIDGIDPAER